MLSKLRFHVRRPSLALIVAVIAVTLGAGGLAVATIPDSGGIIHGCFKNRSGELRVIDTEAQPPEACTARETPLNWNQQGPKGDPGAPGGGGAHAHVLADGTLDAARSTAGISMSRVQFGGSDPGFFPVYCFDLPVQPDNVVATPEKSTGTDAEGVFMVAVEINASVEQSNIAEWGCPSGTDAAVVATQRPNTPLYAAFE
jgi:hypothetical protein